MFITIGKTRFEVELYNNNAARSLVKILPQTLSMTAWGGEFYGTLPQALYHEGDPARDVFDIGEIAFWPANNILCILFGPTPASKAEKPQTVAPCVPIGKIKENIAALDGLSNSLGKVYISMS